MQLLKYDEFKTELLKGISACIPGAYKNYSVEIHRIKKQNQSLDGICMLDKNEHTAVSPVIYAEGLYNSYIDGTSIEDIIKTASDLLFGSFTTASDMQLENVQDNIVPVLIAINGSENILKDMVHIPFLDMAILFRLIVKKDKNGVFGAMVTHDIAKAFELDTDTILKKAKENMKRLLPVSVLPLKTAIPEYKFSRGDIPVFVLSNKYSVDGAAYILDESVLQQLHDIFKRDFYKNLHQAFINMTAAFH